MTADQLLIDAKSSLHLKPIANAAVMRNPCASVSTARQQKPGCNPKDKAVGTPDQEQEQKRRAPGSEQEYQGGQSDKRQDKKDDEQEPERKRA